MRLARFARSLSRVLIAGAMCLVATAVWAQGTVTGRVTAQGSNAPLSDARVLALGTNAAANTAQDGRYTMSGVRAGTIEVQVFKVGYQPLKKTVTVTAGATTNADEPGSALVFVPLCASTSPFVAIGEWGAWTLGVAGAAACFVLSRRTKEVAA